MKLRQRLLPLTIALLFSLNVGLAWGAINYWVVASESSGSWYGVNSQIAVQTNPNATFKVNSVYLRNNTNNWVEAGVCWHWDRPWASPEYFVALKNQGLSMSPAHYDDLTPGSSHSVTARLYDAPNRTWRMYLDGVAKYTTGSMAFSTGTAQASGERENQTESGWAHFSGLRKRNSAGTYSNWSSFTWIDADPGVSLTKVSNYDFYIQ